jgi:hypothetical protein
MPLSGPFPDIPRRLLVQREYGFDRPRNGYVMARVYRL